MARLANDRFRHTRVLAVICGANAATDFRMTRDRAADAFAVGSPQSRNTAPHQLPDEDISFEFSG